MPDDKLPPKITCVIAELNDDDTQGAVFGGAANFTAACTLAGSIFLARQNYSARPDMRIGIWNELDELTGMVSGGSEK